MSHSPSFALLLLALVPAVLPAQQAGLKVAVDSFLDRRIADDAFSGVVLIASKGATGYQRAAGLADREAGVPITLDTRLELGSVTKLFTRIAILQLAQAGKLSLGDTVGKFLPTYPNPVVRHKVTVDQLLQHRSGVGSFWNERYMAGVADVRSVNDYLELFQGDSLLFEPGTGEAYSNGGYVLLGAIIERVSGTSYHEYLRDHVFRPAGMTRTVPYDRRAQPKDAAIGYTRQPLAGPMPGDRRLAGPAGPRPSATPAVPSESSGPRLRIMGADGRELSQEEAQAARARRAASGAPRRPNTAIRPGRSGPAGGHYSTAGDFLKLATAIAAHRLLDSAHTVALYGARYARGEDFRANGGGPGVNAEFSIFPSGEVMVVLSNYDPPAATAIAAHIRALIAGSPAPTSAVDTTPGLQGSPARRPPSKTGRPRPSRRRSQPPSRRGRQSS
jgi:CubicO group peptidase (beta-lactamase class C family)